MSRTRKEDADYVSKFPVDACVPNCKLKSIRYKNTTEREYVVFSFTHGEEWISLFLENPKRSKFETDEAWKKERIRVNACIENILYTYLEDGDAMKEVARMSSDFKTYIQNMIKALEEKKYWDVLVELKTFPSRNGEPVVSYFPPFMRKHGDMNINLSYSDRETKKVIQWRRKFA